MLYPVSVVVPTLYGRTSALLYDAAHAHAGVVLVEREGSLAAGDTLVERICDEVSLYLCAAGVSVLRLATPRGLSATHYAANIVGGVSLLRAGGASRVVLIASKQESASAMQRPQSDGEVESNDIADTAYEGFLDLITARATTPAMYGKLIAELIDTIRDVIDTVIGVVHLVSDAQSDLALPPHPSAPATAAQRVQGATVFSLALSGAVDPHESADYIAQLYTRAMRLLRSAEAMPALAAPITSREPLARMIAYHPAGISTTIWQTLDRVARDRGSTGDTQTVSRHLSG